MGWLVSENEQDQRSLSLKLRQGGFVDLRWGMMVCQPGAGTAKYGQKLSHWMGTWVGWSPQEGGLDWLPEMWNWVFGSIPFHLVFQCGRGFSSLYRGKPEVPTVQLTNAVFSSETRKQRSHAAVLLYSLCAAFLVFWYSSQWNELWWSFMFTVLCHLKTSFVQGHLSSVLTLKWSQRGLPSIRQRMFH